MSYDDPRTIADDVSCLVACDDNALYYVDLAGTGDVDGCSSVVIKPVLI